LLIQDEVVGGFDLDLAKVSAFWTRCHSDSAIWIAGSKEEGICARWGPQPQHQTTNAKKVGAASRRFSA
jgi:hypothetical protein